MTESLLNSWPITALICATLFVFVTAFRRKHWAKPLWLTCLLGSGGFVVFIILAALALSAGESDTHTGFIAMDLMFLIWATLPVSLLFVLLLFVRPRPKKH